MLVSIIIPVYKVEKYIHRCVYSLIHQSYYNLEIILIDDGSPDDCPQICDNLASIDPRIKVIHQQNKGLSAARNIGIDFSSGKYIVFIDSDDFVDKNFILTLYNLLTQNNAQVALANLIEFENNIDLSISNSKEVFKYTREEAIGNLFNELSLPFTTACGTLYDKSLFNNLRFPEGKIHEDVFLTYQLYFLANKIIFTNEVLYFYFRRLDSISKSHFSNRNLNFIEASAQRLYFIQNNCNSNIFNLALLPHLYRLLNDYCKVKLYLKNDYQAQKFMLIELKKIRFKILKNYLLPLRKRWIYFFYTIFPSIYYLRVARFRIRKF